MSEGTATRRWRKLLRFSLRGMIVLVLVIGGGLGWLVRSARIQHAAVAAVTGVGGSVMYDWQWNNRTSYTSDASYTGGASWVPKWVTDRVGTDYFGHVTSVWLYAISRDADSVLIPVGRLKRLEWLSLIGSNISDTGLAHLSTTPSLSRLELDYTKISDAGLIHVERLKGLTILSLNGTRITDSGLVHLKPLASLSELNLAGTPITDAGLVHLQALKSLSILNVVNTKVADQGIIALMKNRPGLRIYR